MGQVSLNEPYRRFLSETAWLLDYFKISLSELGTPISQQRLYRLSGEMTVIRLLDAWARFCRELVIISAGCNPLTVRGTQLARAPGIKRRTEVIPTLMSTYSRRRYEPNWAQATECVDAAQRLRIRNFSTVSGAIGAVGSPVDDLRRVRNFFAHRGKGTVDQVQLCTFYVPSLNFDLESLVGQIVHPGTTRMESWIVNMRALGEAAIQ